MKKAVVTLMLYSPLCSPKKTSLNFLRGPKSPEVAMIDLVLCRSLNQSDDHGCLVKRSTQLLFCFQTRHVMNPLLFGFSAKQRLESQNHQQMTRLFLCFVDFLFREMKRCFFSHVVALFVVDR